MPEAELRERDERAPEREVAEAPPEDRAEPDEDQSAPQDEAAPPKKKRSLLFVGLLIAALVASRRRLSLFLHPQHRVDGRRLYGRPRGDDRAASLGTPVFAGRRRQSVRPQGRTSGSTSTRANISTTAIPPRAPFRSAKAFSSAGLKARRRNRPKNFPALLKQARPSSPRAQAVRAEADYQRQRSLPN